MRAWNIVAWFVAVVVATVILVVAATASLTGEGSSAGYDSTGGSSSPRSCISCHGMAPASEVEYGATLIGGGR